MSECERKLSTQQHESVFIYKQYVRIWIDQRDLRMTRPNYTTKVPVFGEATKSVVISWIVGGR